MRGSNPEKKIDQSSASTTDNTKKGGLLNSNDPFRFRNQTSSSGETSSPIPKETSNPQDKTSQVKDSQTVVNTGDKAAQDMTPPIKDSLSKVDSSQPTENKPMLQRLVEYAYEKIATTDQNQWRKIAFLEKAYNTGLRALQKDGIFTDRKLLLLTGGADSSGRANTETSEQRTERIQREIQESEYWQSEYVQEPLENMKKTALWSDRWDDANREILLGWQHVAEDKITYAELRDGTIALKALLDSGKLHPDYEASLQPKLATGGDENYEWPAYYQR